MQRAGPFFFDVLCGQVYQFEQGHVIGERPFGFGDLTHLTVEPFYCIGGLDYFSDGFRILEVL